ncbi:hypothetical protein [Streptomyces caelestis]|uniref:hypothetical protein n=1 Tax=Streptomyces caelestis TaxID=36816 RepID=UPI0036FEFB94
MDLPHEDRLRDDPSLSLDIYVEDALVDEAPTEPELARRLATALGVPVLCPAEEDLPSAYWPATSSGESVRARLYASDDEPPVHTIDAVGSAVGQLPHIRVSDLPEIAREKGDSQWRRPGRGRVGAT